MGGSLLAFGGSSSKKNIQSEIQTSAVICSYIGDATKHMEFKHRPQSKKHVAPIKAKVKTPPRRDISLCLMSCVGHTPQSYPVEASFRASGPGRRVPLRCSQRLPARPACACTAGTHGRCAAQDRSVLGGLHGWKTVKRCENSG